MGSAIHGLLVREFGMLSLMMHSVFPRYLVPLVAGNLKVLGSEIFKGLCTLSLHLRSQHVMEGNGSMMLILMNIKAACHSNSYILKR